jgi:hypothetical protein
VQSLAIFQCPLLAESGPVTELGQHQRRAQRNPERVVRKGRIGTHWMKSGLRVASFTQRLAEV